MSAGKWARLLDRLTEIEGEIAALYRQLAEVDAALDEHDAEAAQLAEAR